MVCAMEFRDPWIVREPGQLLGRGHCAGELIEAYKWKVIERREGFLRLRAHVPAQVQVLGRHLFAGFTPTYVDVVAMGTVLTANPPLAQPTTVSMRLDYFEPIIGPEFIIESRLLKKRGHTVYVETRLFDPPDNLAVVAQTTVRELKAKSQKSEAS